MPEGHLSGSSHSTVVDVEYRVGPFMDNLFEPAAYAVIKVVYWKVHGPRWVILDDPRLKQALQGWDGLP